MRRLLLPVIFAGLAIAAPAAQQQLQILAAIVDETGKPAASLAPEDVRVTENGTAAKILKIEPVDRRATLQLLIDNGIGLGSENLLHLRNGVRGLIEKLPEGLEVTMVTTAPQPRFLVRATTDRQALLQGVDRIAPDTGAGRFVESLNEATQRIQREKNDIAPIVVAVATTSGDGDVRERDIEQMMKRLQERPTTVHVVLLSGSTGRSSSGGAVQTNVGLAVTEMMRGKFENINSGTRLATLLPEWGDLVAAAASQQSRQYRLFVERTSSGDVGQLGLGVAKPGHRVTSVMLEPSGR